MNYYELLEIQPNASDEVIKMAYKALVKQYHPDVYKGDISYAEKKIKEINFAYDTLSDTEKRAAYNKKIGIMNDDKNAKEVKNTEENIVSKTVRKRTSISIFQRITNGLVDVVVSVGKLIKILISIVVLYVVIGLFTGNLKEWNEKIIYSSKVVVHFVNNINIPTKYEEGSAEEVIQQYIKALYSGDEYTALHMINAEKEDLKTMTEAISAIFRQYEEDILLGDLLTDMKKSKYVIEKTSDDNQYIVTFTTCDYAAILEQVDTKILNDTYIAKQINEAVKCAPKNYKKETVIYMGKVDEKWCIESVEQEKTFIDALTGNFMGQTYEDALQNTGK